MSDYPRPVYDPQPCVALGGDDADPCGCAASWVLQAPHPSTTYGPTPVAAPAPTYQVCQGCLGEAVMIAAELHGEPITVRSLPIARVTP